SLLIADFIRFGDFKPSALVNEHLLTLRNLTRFRNYLVSSIGDLKRKTICILDQIFPEYQSAFANIFGQTSKEILINLSSPADFENISSSMLEKILSEIFLKKFASKKISLISSLAKNSFGITFSLDSLTLQLKLLIQQINFIEDRVKDIEEQIIITLDKVNSPITSIPGISYITGAVILGEIGDINRFSNPSKLVAFAGIDASVSQFSCF
ncbi:MAG: transposase, partial [Fusobacteriales bacterium]|nr:transposase [Fusobacteriales bacterium]